MERSSSIAELQWSASMQHSREGSRCCIPMFAYTRRLLGQLERVRHGGCNYELVGAQRHI